MTRRVRIAQVLGFLALTAALVAALGPADRLRTTYSWPPTKLQGGTPTRLWYTPLLLVQRTPEAVSARVPCSLPRPLRAAGNSVTVLATARYPDRSDGLLVSRTGRRLTVSIGYRVLDRVTLPLSRGAGADCSYRLYLNDRGWLLEGGHAEIEHSDKLETMPTVNGVFSALDLRSGRRPSIEITTRTHASRAAPRQTVAWIVAVLFAVGGLLLVAIEGRPRPRGTRSVLRTTVRAARDAAHPADALVAAILLAWWVLSPAFPDDGWVMTRQSMFESAGGFSNYYNSLGTNLPLSYWLEWAQHWLTQSSSALVVLRIPALLCLAAAWLLCRWVLARVLASSVGDDHIALWALASAFAVGALSWGMTLRPEPVVAVLVAGVLACAVRFVERETVAPIAIAVVLVALAVPAHPSGIVSIAPLLVVGPKLVRWARSRVSVSATILATGVALLVTVAVVGSDLEQRSSDAATIRAYGDATASWQDEVARYNFLLVPPYGTPLRRESVALMGLAVLALLLRTRRNGALLLNLPSAALAMGLLLLILTPSKWPWHFGTLLAIAAVSVACETARLRSQAARPHRTRHLPLLWVGAAMVAAAWSWSARGQWNSSDLRTLDWTLGFESRLSLTNLAAILPGLMLLGAALSEVARRRHEHLREVPWRVASWTVPLLALPLVAFTVGVLVVDAGKTGSWTLTNQNIAALRGDSGCGFADDLVALQPSSTRPLQRIEATASSAPPPAWVPPPPGAGLPRFALGPVTSGYDRSPWFELPSGSRVGVFMAGAIAPRTKLAFEWGRIRKSRVESLASAELAAAPALEVRADIVAWRFLALSEDSVPPRRASAVRIAIRGTGTFGNAVAVTAPVTYATEGLVQTLERAGSRQLVIPYISPYFPCAQQPRLQDGIVEVPSEIVAFGTSLQPILGRTTGPFDGIRDLYLLARLPLIDPELPVEPWIEPETLPPDFAVYQVDRRIAGAKVAPPVKSTVTS